MKHFKSFLILGFFSVMTLTLTACSDDSEKSSSKIENSGDHVWKTQTDALQSAKDMAAKMKESLKQKQEKMDESN